MRLTASSSGAGVVKRSGGPARRRGRAQRAFGKPADRDYFRKNQREANSLIFLLLHLFLYKQ
jgi:hypothetical protein